MRIGHGHGNFVTINDLDLDTLKSYLLLLLVFLLSCDTRNGVDREAVKEEMANRELKRLRNSDILQRGEEIGKMYFSFPDSSQTAAYADSLKLKVVELKSAETDEEKELLEAFLYASENNQDIEDYVSDSPEQVFFYHPEIIGNYLVITRLTISKKEIVRSL